MLSTILATLSRQLVSHSETPQLDAELLLAKITQQTRTQLFAHPEKILSPEEQQELSQVVKRRMTGEPMAYILGHQEFWSLDMKVTSAVLIPRPETEMLVDWALKHLPNHKKQHIADLGTGSGAIAIALAHECPRWMIAATENSEKALVIAKENAARHAVKNVTFYLGHWCDALPRRDYHAILGNPPYIAEKDSHLPHLSFEPQSALVSGKEGLDAIKKIIVTAKDYLCVGGYVVLEHGYDQSEKIFHLMKENNYRDIKDYTDLAGLPRMIVGKK